MPIMTNKKGSRVTILATADETFTLAQLKVDASETTVDSAIITDMSWSTAGVIKVARGANTVANLTGTGQWDNTAISKDSTGSLVLTVPADSTLVIHVKKRSDFVSDYLGPNIIA